MVSEKDLRERILSRIHLQLLLKEAEKVRDRLKEDGDWDSFVSRLFRFLAMAEWHFEGAVDPFRWAQTAVKEYLEGRKQAGDEPEKIADDLVEMIRDEDRKQKKQAPHTGGMRMAALKNAQQYTEKLDAIASEIEATAPEMAFQLDKVADVIEGKREASTLKFDPDEAKYMAGRFNFNVKNREADEPFMDDYNRSNFEQVMGIRKSPTPIRVAYQKVPEQK